MLQKLIAVIKERKRLFGTILVIGIFVILVILGIDNSVKDDLSQLPFFIKRTSEPVTGGNVKTRGNLVLENVSPPSGSRENNTDYVGTIVFTFNLPIDPKSIKYYVTPSVNLEVGVYKNSPTRVWVKPASRWFVGIEHTIVINDIASTSGDYIGNKIEYKYFTNPPKVLENIPD